MCELLTAVCKADQSYCTVLRLQDVAPVGTELSDAKLAF